MPGGRVSTRRSRISSLQVTYILEKSNISQCKIMYPNNLLYIFGNMILH